MTTRLTLVTMILLIASFEPIRVESQTHGQNLIDTAASGNSAAVQRLLAAGADPNVRDRFGRTALVEATAHALFYGDHSAVVQQLLAAGADPNIQDPDGETALMKAARSGQSDIAQHLVAAGADPNIQEKRGRTALMVATRHRHSAVVQQLLEAVSKTCPIS